MCIRLRGCETEWVWGTCVDSGISLCLKLLGGSWEHKSSEKSTVCVYTSIFVIFDLRRVFRAAFATLNWSRSCRSNLCSSFALSRRRIPRSASLRRASEAASLSYGTGLSQVKQYSLSGRILGRQHGTACVNELCFQGNRAPQPCALLTGHFFIYFSIFFIFFGGKSFFFWKKMCP